MRARPPEPRTAWSDRQRPSTALAYPEPAGPASQGTDRTALAFTETERLVPPMEASLSQMAPPLSTPKTTPPPLEAWFSKLCWAQAVHPLSLETQDAVLVI